MGASGGRIEDIRMTMLDELHRRGGGYGAAAICGGPARRDAVRIEAD